MSGGAAPSRLEQVSDPELLRNLVEGDLRALGALYDRYARDVWRVVRRTLGDAPDVEDVVQATFLCLPRIAASYDGRTNCRNWVRGIAVRMALRHRRGLGRFRRMLEVFARTKPPSQGPDPEEQASSKEDLSRLERGIHRLSSKKRAVFVLVELEGLSSDEVARALGLPQATVRTRLFHARRELQAALARRVARREGP
jgi:RNA polymerase sigma-70 factor, ECF subfamily